MTEEEDFEEEDFNVHHIDEMVRYYRKYPDWAKAIEVKFVTLFRFLDANQLLKKRIVGRNGRLLKRELDASDYTKAGLEFERRFVPRWLDSKGSQKDPTNTALLEKYLKQLRTKRQQVDRSRTKKA